MESNLVTDINYYDFDLPEELIAQTPEKKRDHSRLLVLNKDEQTIEHHHFYDIINYLREGYVSVRNNSKVIWEDLVDVFDPSRYL